MIYELLVILLEKKGRMIPVYIADDHKMVAEGLEKSIHSTGAFSVVKCFTNGTELYNALEQINNSLLILDLNLTDLNGIEILTSIQEKNLSINVFVLTMYNDLSLIEKCKKLGARGYILKNSTNEELCWAMQHIDETFYYGKGVKRKSSHPELFKDGFLLTSTLTKRELEIIKLLTQDYSSNEIAKELNLSSHTVDTHRRNLIKKLNVKGVAGVINFAHENKLT
jgi:DNA-binding NarL/FixJ family response regulator